MQIRDTAQFSYDYFSGANVGLYVRDILIGTAVGVEFSLVQNKRPVFGYASQLWDGVARGTVQCSGFLLVNFQYAQYLPALISRYHGTETSGDFYTDKFHSDYNEMNGAEAIDVHSWENTDGLSQRKYHDRLKTIYWGGDAASELDASLLENTDVGRPDQHNLAFDMIITYGDAFGNELRRRDGQPSPTLSAVRTLRQVQLTGFGQTITVEGEPVLEQYPFICREVT